MITNDVQNRVTKGHLREFEEALANLEAEPATKPAKLHKLEIDAVQGMIDDFRAEIAEYENLLSGEISTFEAPTLAAFATLLVKPHITRGWTQRRRAEELGVGERQIQPPSTSGPPMGIRHERRGGT